MDLVSKFVQKVIETFATGHAREHSYRPALKELFEGISALKVINEPKRSEHGAPDFVFLKGKIVVAYAEAKDINVSLAEVEKSEQMERYYGYSNIILTNGLEFRFYRNASSVCEPVTVGELHNGTITTHENKFQLLADTISDFIKDSKEPIKSGSVLSKVMAGKARRIRDNIKEFLAQPDNPKNKNLLDVYEVIKKTLLADLDKAKFADMYAQTLVYGLFVARYHDTTNDSFSRAEARDLVPSSNPFLRHFFDHLAGPSFDARLEYIVNELCEEFTHADVRAIVHNFYKVDKDDSRDPIIHFYEDFLQEYDSAERKKLGVFYTPLPVVRFIVRAVDDILKKEFDLVDGLADTSKIDIVREISGKKGKDTVHRVQVLDPATGTGTFLNEVILHIKKSFEGQEGRWNSYVNTDLLPRLHGFELMMASYTIAHLKLSSTIIESGAKITDSRLGVYLTNSLEQSEKIPDQLFDVGLSKAITEESNQAYKIKNEMPVMVVIGNPPYSVSSQNKSSYIEELTQEYKKDMDERNIQPLSDDYIKFIRLAENLVEKNTSGVIGMITNNSFLDGVIHRQMRKHLLETFDSIYIIDLHGSSKKKEKTLDGGKDENIFAIQQGVSIALFVKKGGKKKGLGKVYHSDLLGKREYKFNVLNNQNISLCKWTELKYSEPYYFFVPKDFTNIKDFERGFKIDDIFLKTNVGIVTSRDNFAIDFNESNLVVRKNDIVDTSLSDEDFGNKYPLKKFDYAQARKKTLVKDESSILKLFYRPFDIRYILYNTNFIERSRHNIMRHMLNSNIGLICSKISTRDVIDNVQITNSVIELKFNSHDRNSNIFPLYLYHEDGTKVPNLKKEIVTAIEKVVGTTTPEDILDYVYAVLHSPTYRETYKEFLKIDFPRVPYPADKNEFWKLVVLGTELRQLHLLESAKLNSFVTTFPESGTDTIDLKPKYKDGNVYINDVQYFGNVPEVAWNFYIGGYQPAQKWLKDRQGRTLSNDDIKHYQKMIVALVETARVMGEIDKVLK